MNRIRASQELRLKLAAQAFLGCAILLSGCAKNGAFESLKSRATVPLLKSQEQLDQSPPPPALPIPSQPAPVVPPAEKAFEPTLTPTPTPTPTVAQALPPVPTVTPRPVAASAGLPAPSPAPTPPPTPTPASAKEEAFALPWERRDAAYRKRWSQFVFKIVNEEFANLDQVRDAEAFCPKYALLDEKQKKKFFAVLVAEISFHESSWNAGARTHEKTMGIDQVTGLPVHSEGLLQLSYQDIQWAPYCQFDWNKDKHLNPRDPRKTILDPFKNLHCGIKILASQIANKKEILLKGNVYWSVLKEEGKFNRIEDIVAGIRKNLNFCQ